MKRFLPLLCILILNLQNLSAQLDLREGYIITNNFDTITGLIKDEGILNNSQYCLFTPNEETPLSRYSPDELTGYRFSEEEYYVSDSIVINEVRQLVFLEYIFDGASDLYFYRDINGNHYFIQKEDGKLIELQNESYIKIVEGKDFTVNTNRHIGLLKAYFSDCEEISSEIDHIGLNHKSLISLSQNYHDIVCPGEQCHLYVRQEEKAKFFFAPEVGYRFARLRNEDEINKDETMTFYSSGFSIGGGTAIQMPMISRNTLIMIKADFGHDYFSDYIETDIYKSFDRFKYYTIDSYFTNIQISIDQAFTRGRIKPAIGAGPAFYCELYSNSNAQIETITDGISEIEEVPIFPYPSLFIGLAIQLGVRFEINEQSFIMLGASLTWYTGMEQHNENFLQSQRISAAWYF